MAEKKIPENDDEEQDDELDFGAQGPLLIPEGIYEVGFLRRETDHPHWGGEKIYLWFEILDCGEFQGEELCRPYNKPKKGKNGRVPISSIYYQDCVLASAGKPIRWDRPNAEIFRGKRFLVTVRTVTTGPNKEPRPEALHYSIIGRLIKLLTDSEKP